MNRKENYDFEELQELLWQAEEAMQEPVEEPAEEDYSQYVYPEAESEDPMIYRNYANGYGTEQTPSPSRPAQRPASQGDGRSVRHSEARTAHYSETQSDRRPESRPAQHSDPRTSYRPDGRPVHQSEARSAHHAEGRSAYHSEPREDYDDYQQPVYRDPPRQRPAQQKKSAPHKKRRRGCGCGCGCFVWLLLLIAAIAAAIFLTIRPPQSADSIGERKADTATILVCGTDKDGTRTDTMMLLYLSGSEQKVSLLSLPRDSYTITSSGKAAKLNSAFGRGGSGEEGMETLLDYVKDIVGYRPDGYILVDFTLVPQIVDIMGGVDVEVPMDMTVDGVSLEAGYQHLTGTEALTLLRFRKGYAMADLTRIEVQRSVVKACLEQWLSVDHIGDALDAVSLLESGSLSSLSIGNYVWVAKTLLLSMDNFQNDTLPGYADYRGGVSYYILSKSKIVELINQSYNPYVVPIREESLNIAG